MGEISQGKTLPPVLCPRAKLPGVEVPVEEGSLVLRGTAQWLLSPIPRVEWLAQEGCCGCVVAQ